MKTEGETLKAKSYVHFICRIKKIIRFHLIKIEKLVINIVKTKTTIKMKQILNSRTKINLKWREYLFGIYRVKCKGFWW